MSTPPIQGFQAAIDKVADPHTRMLFHLTFDRLGNHAQAFGIQQQKINALKSSTAASGGGTVVETGGGGGVPPVVGIFTVNDQSGETAYTTQPGDNGALIVLSDASPIALTLAGAAVPYGVIVANQGAGTVTVTPAVPPGSGSSTISYPANPGAVSMPLPSGYGAICAYDGISWWAELITDGTVTSVALAMPVEFSVAGSPITGAGTFTVTKSSQSANTVYAGPSSGSPAVPTFRALANADLPAAVPVVSFGTGAPAGSSTEGYLYFDTTGSPYHGYVYHSGAWNQFS